MEINKEGKEGEDDEISTADVRNERKEARIQRCVCIPEVIGCLGGCSDIRKKTNELFEDKRLLNTIIMEMSKTVVFESQTILSKVLSGLMDEAENNGHPLLMSLILM